MDYAASDKGVLSVTDLYFSTMWVETERQSRFCTAQLRAASPIVLRKVSFCKSSSSLRARSAVFDFLKTQPVSLSVTISAKAETLDTSMVLPIAMASSGFMGETISQTGHALRGK